MVQASRCRPFLAFSRCRAPRAFHCDIEVAEAPLASVNSLSGVPMVHILFRWVGPPGVKYPLGGRSSLPNEGKAAQGVFPAGFAVLAASSRDPCLPLPSWWWWFPDRTGVQMGWRAWRPTDEASVFWITCLWKVVHSMPDGPRPASVLRPLKDGPCQLRDTGQMAHVRTRRGSGGTGSCGRLW